MKLSWILLSVIVKSISQVKMLLDWIEMLMAEMAVEFVYIYEVILISVFAKIWQTKVVLDQHYSTGSDVTTGSDGTGSDVIPHFPIGLRRFSLPEVTSL